MSLSTSPRRSERGPAPRSFDPTRRTLQLTTGIRLAYVEAGDPEGPVVIFLHGFTDTARSFFPTLEALCAQGAPLHAFALDQRGHGASSMPDARVAARAPEREFGFRQLASDVIAFLDALGLRTAHIVGHSMGSVVAQELALSHPDRIESLTLVGAFVCGTESAAFNEFLVPLIEGAWKSALTARPGFVYPEHAYLLTPLDADPGALAWLRDNWVADAATAPSHLDAVLPETAATRLGTWIGLLRAQREVDLRERLTTLSVPTLVIWSTQDNYFPARPDQQRVVAALEAAVEAGHLDHFFYKIYTASSRCRPRATPTATSGTTCPGALARPSRSTSLPGSPAGNRRASCPTPMRRTLGWSGTTRTAPGSSSDAARLDPPSACGADVPNPSRRAALHHAARCRVRQAQPTMRAQGEPRGGDGSREQHRDDD